MIYTTIVPRNADTLYINGRIYTMDASGTIAEAMAIRGDRIEAVGTTQELERTFTVRSVIDLHGAAVFPGFIDSHAHFFSLGLAMMTVDLVGAGSEAEAVERTAARLRHTEPGAWVRGRGWDQTLWPGAKFPTKESLDRIAPEHPIFLVRIDGHAAWVNSKALTLAGITKETPDPPGGKIVRDAAGAPTGVLIDNAMELAAARMPRTSNAELMKAAGYAGEECAANGLTTIHDMGMEAEEIEVCKQLAEAGSMPLRIYAAVNYGSPAWEQFKSTGPLRDAFKHRFSVGMVKLYMDGALGSRGAALFDAYADDPANRGLTMMSEKEYEQALRDAKEHGAQVAVHAIGDRANYLALNGMEHVLGSDPEGKYRWRVEHVQILAPSDIPRFKKTGIIPSMQPAHCTSDMYWAQARLGWERVRGAYAWRTLLDAGCIIPGGSDFPIEYVNPLFGIYAAVTRQDRNGLPGSAGDVTQRFDIVPSGSMDTTDFSGGWFVRQRMTREEAIKAFTVWGAYAAFQENIKGTLESGKLADFVVLSKDIMTVPPVEILSTEVELTVLGGACVYARPKTSTDATR